MISEVSLTFVGNGTNTIGSRLRGRIHAVKVVADSSVTNSFDITLSGATTEVPILLDESVSNNTTTWFYPRAFPNQNTDGAAETDATESIYVLNEAITCVTANAGTTGTIVVTVFYEE
ncbi:MAG TPA: hypothetical protein VMX74_11570 [Pirellulales bacterium]|nr:hypothetical protein [Pirellulales bacterium]